MLSDQLRLPDFLLAGAPRCGTTSLFDALKAHPELCLPDKKELWFFYSDEVWQQGIEWYASNFINCATDRIAGEATPLYFCDEESRNRISQTLPNVKFLLVLRNPIDRLISHYVHNRLKSSETLTIEQAIEVELSGARPTKLNKGALNYVEIGHYDIHINALMKSFSPNQMHVVILEELIGDPDKAFSSIWNFFGVSAVQVPDFSRKNKGRQHRSTIANGLYKDVRLKQVIGKLLPEAIKKGMRQARDAVVLHDRPMEISLALREQLQSIYLPSILRLEKLLGRDLMVWRSDWKE